MNGEIMNDLPVICEFCNLLNDIHRYLYICNKMVYMGDKLLHSS